MVAFEGSESLKWSRLAVSYIILEYCMHIAALRKKHNFRIEINEGVSVMLY